MLLQPRHYHAAKPVRSVTFYSETRPEIHARLPRFANSSVMAFRSWAQVIYQASARCRIKQALIPPKPNELERAIRISACRPWFGT
jgi:hypothetical protein